MNVDVEVPVVALVVENVLKFFSALMTRVLAVEVEEEVEELI